MIKRLIDAWRIWRFYRPWRVHVVFTEGWTYCGLGTFGLPGEMVALGPSGGHLYREGGRHFAWCIACRSGSGQIASGRRASGGAPQRGRLIHRFHVQQRPDAGRGGTP